MEDTDATFKIFQVTRKYKDPYLSKMIHFGDNCGEIYELSSVVAGLSVQDAIDSEWTKMKQEMKKILQEAKDVKSGVTSKPLFHFYPPRIPVKKEKWIAKEVIIPGFIITVNRAD